MSNMREWSARDCWSYYWRLQGGAVLTVVLLVSAAVFLIDGPWQAMLVGGLAGGAVSSLMATWALMRQSVR